jgi:hypothetical protein
MKDTPQGDEKEFNDTLKRMLSTPPKPHKKDAPVRPNEPSRDGDHSGRKKSSPKTR